MGAEQPKNGTANNITGSVYLPNYCGDTRSSLTIAHPGLVASVPVVTAMSAFIAIAWYNVLALNVVIWFTFKRRSGLYFYALLIASWGIVVHQLGFLLMFFGVSNVFAVSVVVINVGWYSMVRDTAPWTRVLLQR